MKNIVSRFLFLMVLLISVFFSLTNKTIVFATTQSNGSTGNYSFVVTSDPQFPWTDKTDNGISESESEKKVVLCS